MTTDELDRLEALEALAAKATPGPWAGCAHVAGTDPDCPCRYRGDVVSKATDEVLLQMRVGPDEHPGASDDDSWKDAKTTDPDQGYANGRFIAACDPDTIRRLVAMARSASGEAAAREFVESLTPGAAAREPLDVERLAEAIAAVAVERSDQLHSQPPVWEERPEWVAGWIAAEYAALRKPVTA